MAMKQWLETESNKTTNAITTGLNFIQREYLAVCRAGENTFLAIAQTL
jgi:hypothetical protein